MAHKKSLLSKFMSDSEETDDSSTSRSAIHNGKTWIIPETSNSDKEKSYLNVSNNKNDQEPEKEEVVMPSTSSFQNHITVISSGKLQLIFYYITLKNRTIKYYPLRFHQKYTQY